MLDLKKGGISASRLPMSTFPYNEGLNIEQIIYSIYLSKLQICVDLLKNSRVGLWFLQRMILFDLLGKMYQSLLYTTAYILNIPLGLRVKMARNK